jgi:hypothetical protein
MNYLMNGGILLTQSIRNWWGWGVLRIEFKAFSSLEPHFQHEKNVFLLIRKAGL